MEDLINLNWRTKMQKRSKIQITEHAKKRLSQRVKDVRSCDYNGFVNTARYSGMTLYDLSINKPQIASYIRKKFKTYNSSQIRFYQGCVFLFSGNKGKAHTLVTVVNLKDVKELCIC